VEDACTTANECAWDYALTLSGSRIGEAAVLEKSPDILTTLRGYVAEMSRLLDEAPTLPN